MKNSVVLGQKRMGCVWLRRLLAEAGFEALELFVDAGLGRGGGGGFGRGAAGGGGDDFGAAGAAVAHGGVGEDEVLVEGPERGDAEFFEDGMVGADGFLG